MRLCSKLSPLRNALSMRGHRELNLVRLGIPATHLRDPDLPDISVDWFNTMVLERLSFFFFFGGKQPLIRTTINREGKYWMRGTSIHSCICS